MAQKRFWLTLSLLGNLGVLSYFKYGEFAVENFAAALAMAGIHYEPAPWSILLPVGISFYTFQTLSYTLDLFKGRTKPTDSFLDFALFVTFFPQLVAGPIVRARRFLPQLVAFPTITREQFSWGLILVVVGLFQKVVIADAFMGPIADRFYAMDGVLPAFTVTVAAFAFIIQILCDFSGYSLIAIGIAKCLGFELPENFRAPYAALGYQDLWQRWHISMSSWFRDYLYAAVRGKSDRSLPNMLRSQMITMTLIGLWHGAGWNFIAWGFYNGCVLVTEVLLRRVVGHWKIWQGRVMKVFFILLTFCLFTTSGIFFRAESLAQAGDRFLSYVSAPDLVVFPYGWEIALTVGVTASVLALHGLMRNQRFEEFVETVPVPVRVLALAGMLVAIGMAGGNADAFIYFQF